MKVILKSLRQRRGKSMRKILIKRHELNAYLKFLGLWFSPPRSKKSELLGLLFQTRFFTEKKSKQYLNLQLYFKQKTYLVN